MVQLAPILINTISWKTYFVFFCFNVAFISIMYFPFPENNGYMLETLDEIFEIAHCKHQNPVRNEKAFRKCGRSPSTVDGANIEKADSSGSHSALEEQSETDNR